MLLPTQRLAGLAATNMMASMLDVIEERRRAEEDKLKGTDKQKDIAPALEQDQTAKATNEKISAHFFGALKLENDPVAAFLASFENALGVTQDEDETNRDFARRLQDALDMSDLVEKTGNDGKRQSDAFGALNVGLDDIAAVMRGETPGSKDSADTAGMVARYALRAGISADDEDLAILVGNLLNAVRSNLPKNVEQFEKDFGLKKMGLTARDVVAAIENPWSAEGRKVEKAVYDHIAQATGISRETLKIIQRLEGVSNPKSAEELKSERDEKGSAQVQDAETRVEREQDIRHLEQVAKLDGVINQQEALARHNAQVMTSGASPLQAAQAESMTLQVLAAAVEQQDITADASKARKADHAQQSKGDTMVALLEEAPDSEATMAQMKLAPEIEVALETRKYQADTFILPVRLDENGIYELLKKKAA